MTPEQYPADAGMVLVPRHPTPSMMDAGSAEYVFLKTQGHLSDGSADRVWQAMIAAAEAEQRD